MGKMLWRYFNAAYIYVGRRLLSQADAYITLYTAVFSLKIYGGRE